MNLHFVPERKTLTNLSGKTKNYRYFRDRPILCQQNWQSAGFGDYLGVPEGACPAGFVPFSHAEKGTGSVMRQICSFLDATKM